MIAEYIVNTCQIKITPNTRIETETPNKLIIKSMGEFSKLYKASEVKWEDVSIPEKHTLLASAPLDSKLYEAFKQLSDKHMKKLNKDIDGDKLKKLKYQSPIDGTSKLIRLASKGEIQIAFRKGKTTFNQNSYDCVCIDNKVREQFFSACKKAEHYKPGKYKILKADIDDYLYWDQFMHSEFLAQYKMAGGECENI